MWVLLIIRLRTNNYFHFSLNAQIYLASTSALTNSWAFKTYAMDLNKSPLSKFYTPKAIPFPLPKTTKNSSSQNSKTFECSTQQKFSNLNLQNPNKPQIKFKSQIKSPSISSSPLQAISLAQWSMKNFGMQQAAKYNTIILMTSSNHPNTGSRFLSFKMKFWLVRRNFGIRSLREKKQKGKLILTFECENRLSWVVRWEITWWRMCGLVYGRKDLWSLNSKIQLLERLKERKWGKWNLMRMIILCWKQFCLGK